MASCPKVIIFPFSPAPVNTLSVMDFFLEDIHSIASQQPVSYVKCFSSLISPFFSKKERKMTEAAL